MNIFATYSDWIGSELIKLQAQGLLPSDLPLDKILVESPSDLSHGDLTTNAAMVLAKPAGKVPRDLAVLIAESIKTLPDVTDVAIAGPGFINITLTLGVWQRELVQILKSGASYGDSDQGKSAPSINIEYVSANPTGPMHTAHARGAIIGDALANLLQKAGYKVTREYYLNDAGNQVNVLGRSTYLRYREALGETIDEIPSGLYPGEYLKEVAENLVAADGGEWLNVPEVEWLPIMRDFAIETILAEIKADLHALGIHHDVFSSERALIQKGAVQKAVDKLQSLGLLYHGVLEPPKGKTPEDWEPRPQLLFKSNQFGDDVDRPLQKSDGSFTYFASDIAYHLDKLERGCPILIDIMGADHGGYVKRMQAAVAAISEGKADLDIKLCQLVHVLENGVPVKMSKRAGTFITLRDVIDRVGRDVIRFIMLTRRNDQTLDFDYAKVTEQSKDNPVFYVQYAHARCCSLFRNAREVFTAAELENTALASAPLANLINADELRVIRLLATWPRVVELAAKAHEPHRIAFYLQDLASAFHTFRTNNQIIDTADKPMSLSRLALARGTAFVIASGLNVIGVVPVEELRS